MRSFYPGAVAPIALWKSAPMHVSKGNARRTSKTATNQNGHNPKRPQTKTATKRPQSDTKNHIHLANEKSFGRRIFIITDEI